MRARRWASPQPAPSWTGVRPAIHYGARCPQLASTNGPGSTNEGCLFVNVQRPHGAASGKRLPVYVFIHGGGLVNGSGDQHDGTQFIQRAGVVHLTMNYRLGPLGFLVTRELNGTRGDAGNYGFQDQQAALRWVQRNIAAFGGDPGAVTIGGESAGGWSVCAHLTAPGSAGLFSRAMIQSGSCASQSQSSAEAAGRTVAAAVNCRTAATSCLRRVSVARLLKAGLEPGSVQFTHGTPTLPQAPDAAVRAGHFSRVPVVIGANRDEGRTFMQGNVGWTRKQYEAWVRGIFAARAPAVLARYPWPATSDRFTGVYLTAAIATDSGLIANIGGCPNLALTRALDRWTRVYAYQFDHRTGPGLTPQLAGYVWGAGHAAELAYLWPSFDNGPSIAARFSPAERQLSRDMTRYWGSFVEGRAPWTGFSGGGPVLSLRAGGDGRLIDDKRVAAQHQCAFWNPAG